MADIDTLMPPAQVQPMDDEETLRRKLITNAGGMSAMPAASRGPSSGDSGGQGMPPAQTAPTQRSRPFLVPSGMPPVGATKAEPEPVGAPTMPAANVGPQQKRYNDLSAQGAPELHGWKKVLNAIGSVSPLGRSIESAIPGSPENYNEALNSAAVRAAKEQGITGTGLAQQKEQQEIQDEPGKRELARRNTESEITARGDKDSQQLAQHGLKRDPNTSAVVADEDSPVFKANQQKQQLAEETQKNVQSLRESQISLNDAKTEVEQAKNDPNSPAYKQAQQKLQMAQRAHDVAAANLGLHQAEFANKQEEQGLLKPSGQAQSRGSAAQSVLTLLPGLEASVRKNAGSMGPLMGRLAKGEIAIGDVPPDVAELYSAMKSFYALQPAVHGFRNAEFVKDFEHALGTLERDPEAFIAGMKGLKPTLESVRDEGKTFHKRIVEGGGNKPAVGGGKLEWNPKSGKYE